MVDPQLHGLSEHLFVAAMVVVVVSSGQQLVMVDQPRHVLSALMKAAAMHEEETQEPPSSSTPPPTLSFQNNKKDISMSVIKKNQQDQPSAFPHQALSDSQAHYKTVHSKRPETGLCKRPTVLYTAPSRVPL